ncbi:hypothetical protein [Ornithinimicrobium kibberense]|uniref:hypothetical protein n=1 Tax=Ornithinimicrobium kibberense TaxID=282060 RepID=UPI00360E15EE
MDLAHLVGVVADVHRVGGAAVVVLGHVLLLRFDGPGLDLLARGVRRVAQPRPQRVRPGPGGWVPDGVVPPGAVPVGPGDLQPAALVPGPPGGGHEEPVCRGRVVHVLAPVGGGLGRPGVVRRVQPRSSSGPRSVLSGSSVVTGPWSCRSRTVSTCRPTVPVPVEASRTSPDAGPSTRRASPSRSRPSRFPVARDQRTRQGCGPGSSSSTTPLRGPGVTVMAPVPHTPTGWRARVPRSRAVSPKAAATTAPPARPTVSAARLAGVDTRSRCAPVTAGGPP